MPLMASYTRRDANSYSKFDPYSSTQMLNHDKSAVNSIHGYQINNSKPNQRRVVSKRSKQEEKKEEKRKHLITQSRGTDQCNWYFRSE